MTFSCSHVPNLCMHVCRCACNSTELCNNDTLLLLTLSFLSFCTEHHQARFFSDQTPPPVPKKSLRRTISLPTDALDPPYPAHSGTHNYDNPLYMIAPFQDQKENYEEELHEGQSLQQVTFEIPDEQLCRLLRSFQSYEQVSMSIQECYLQFLREALLKIETSVFVNEQESKIAKTSHPNDFLLYGRQWTGKDVYYLVCCPKIPRRLFAAKVTLVCVLNLVDLDLSICKGLCKLFNP